MPVLLTGCTYSGSLPSNSTSYIQNTLSPSTTTQAFSVQTSSTSDGEYLSYITGTQCLEEVNGKTVGTGAACGSGSGGGVWGSITGTLSSQTDLQTIINNIGSSTATLEVQIVNVGVSTASLQVQLTNVGISTTAVASSTSSIQVQINGLETSTTTLQTELNAVGVSTTNIAASTSSLQSQVSLATTFSSFTAVQPILYNGAGQFSATLISLSTGVTSSLSAASIANGALGSGVIASSLTATAVTPGSYTNTNLTVNQEGQITSASNGSGGSGGGGYAVAPATVTFLLNQGVTASTMTSASITWLSTGAYVNGQSNNYTVIGATTPLNNQILTVAGGIEVSTNDVSGNISSFIFPPAAGSFPNDPVFYAPNTSGLEVGIAGQFSGTLWLQNSNNYIQGGSNYLALTDNGSNGLYMAGGTQAEFYGTGIANSALSVKAPASNVYDLYLSTSETGGNSVAISTTSEFVLNGSTGTPGQALTSQGPGSPVKWMTISGGSGAATIAISAGVQRSSPTTDVIFPSSEFFGSVSASSMTVTVNTSSFTLQGPIVSSITLASMYGAPALTGTNITSIPASSINAGSLGASVIASSITLAAMYGAPTLIGTNFTSLPGAQVGSGVPAANIASGSLGSSVIASSITLAAMYGAPTLTGTNFTSLPGSQVGSGVPAANIAAGPLGPLVIASSLTATGVGAGSCMNCNLTYNAEGQLTVAANGTGGSSGASALAVSTGGVSGWTGPTISSPTAVILFDSTTFKVSLIGGATAFVQSISTVTGGGGTPAGSNYNVQVASAGAFGAAPDFNVYQSSVVIGAYPGATYTTYISTLQVTGGSLTVNNIGALNVSGATLGITDNANTYNVGESTGFVLSASSTTSNTALTTFANFMFQIPASESWRFLCNIMVTGATGGAKYGINGPAGATVGASIFGPLGSATAFTSGGITALNTATIAFHTVAAATFVRIEGVMTTSSTAGQWTLQREEGISGDTTTALANSFCTAFRIL